MPEHWEKLIQRCVLARRDEMVSSIVSQGAGARKQERDDTREELSRWHGATQRAAIQEAVRTGLALRYPLAVNLVQSSYLIRHRKDESIEPGQALSIIEKMNTAVRDTVRHGWSMFYPFTRKEIRPHFLTDSAVDACDTEFIQPSLHEDGGKGHGDFWRLSLDGRASLLRNFHEDRFSTPQSVPEGQLWFDPFYQVQDITEIVRHARAYAEEFADVTEICFQLEWKGLKSTVIASHRNRYDSESYPFNGNAQRIRDCFPQAEIIGSLPAVVARLFSPVHRMFNPRSDYSADSVARVVKVFIEPGVSHAASVCDRAGLLLSSTCIVPAWGDVEKVFPRRYD